MVICEGGPRERFIIASVAPFLEFGADRARQRKTKAGIRESEHCNWRRDRKRMATDRDRGRNTQREDREGVEEA